MIAVDRCYFVPLDVSLSTQGRLRGLLSAHDQEHLAAFENEHLRNRYITAHGILRALIASEAGVPPQAVDIRSDRFGRPALFVDAVQGTFDFNMSHSENWLMIGLSHGTRIGVDIELWRKVPFAADQLANILSTEELDVVRDALKNNRCDASFAALRLWTLKEATLKAYGSGLRIEPRCVHLDPAALSCLIRFGSMDTVRSVAARLEGIDVLWSVSCLPFPYGSAAVARPQKGKDPAPIAHRCVGAAELLRMEHLA